MPAESGKYTISRLWVPAEFLLVALIIAYASYLTIPDSLVNVRMSVTSKHIELISKSDFIIFYTAGRIAGSRQPDNIYDLDTQRKIQADTIGIHEDNIALFYFYPPQTLLFFIPLAHFTVENASFIWHGCNAFFTFLLIVALYYAGICSKSGTVLIATVLLVTSNVWIDIMANGQPTILITLGLLGCQLLARYKHIALAGVLLMLTAFKPQLIVAPTLYLLIIYGRGLWMSVGGALLVVVVTCSAFFGISIWHTYIQTLIKVPDLLRLGYGVMKMCNVRTLAFTIFGEKHFEVINAISTSLWLACIMAACCMAFLVRHKTEEVKDLGLALIIAIVCVFSPYLWANSLIILLISLGYLLKYSGLRGLYPIVIGLQFFNWIAMRFPAEVNPLLWVPAQFLLILWIGIVFSKKYFQPYQSL